MFFAVGLERLPTKLIFFRHIWVVVSCALLSDNFWTDFGTILEPCWRILGTKMEPRSHSRSIWEPSWLQRGGQKSILKSLGVLLGTLVGPLGLLGGALVKNNVINTP